MSAVHPIYEEGYSMINLLRTLLGAEALGKVSNYAESDLEVVERELAVNFPHKF